MELVLTRDYSNGTLTMGALAVNGKKFHTVERPWIANTHGGLAGEKFRSCVGPGEYRLERHDRPSGEKAFILSNPALDVYRLPTDVPKGRMVTSSREAMNQLRTLIGNAMDLKLTIRYAEGIVPGGGRFGGGGAAGEF